DLRARAPGPPREGCGDLRGACRPVRPRRSRGHSGGGPDPRRRPSLGSLSAVAVDVDGVRRSERLDLLAAAADAAARRGSPLAELFERIATVYKKVANKFVASPRADGGRWRKRTRDARSRFSCTAVADATRTQII